jgi:glycosyltransferase involved in cell wall biosynthesis
MDFSIIICTYNRASDLARALQSLCGLEIPPGIAWEVIVVNNASTDETPSVLQAFSEKLPLTGVYEAKRGLSHARNAGVEKASGAYVLWIDDDVTVDRFWLKAYADAAQAFPNAALFGGAVVPKIMEPTPQWFADGQTEIGSLLCRRNAADYGPRILTHGELPFGANFVVRRAELRRYPFDPNLGVTPWRRRSGEETAVILQLLGDGAEGRWIPEARVQHWIPPAKQSLAFIARYYQGEGEKIAHMKYAQDWLRRGPALLLYSAKALKAYARYVLSRNRNSHPTIWLSHFLRLSISLGVVRYLLSFEQS